MNCSRVLPALVFATLLSSFPATAFGQQSSHPILDASGFQPHRDYFSEMPFEQVDTLSGALILRFTDLVLPGNAGSELRFERTYNSKSRSWSFGIAGVPLRIANPPRPSVNQIVGVQDATPTLYLSDGSVRTMAWFQSPNPGMPSTLDKAISQEFWIFDRTGTMRRLQKPNGQVCDYLEQTDPTDLRVQQCRDAFNNQVDFQWSADPLQLVITQHLDSATARVITISLKTGTIFPEAVTYNGSTWQYDVSANLLAVTPPVGPAWTFTYASNNHLESITTPHGGTISYTYENLPYVGPDPLQQYSTWVVKTKEQTDNANVIGTWEYSYTIVSNGLSAESTVDLPVATGAPHRRVLYAYEAFGDPAFLFGGDAGSVALDHRIVQEEGSNGWADIEREDREYVSIPVLSYFAFGTLEPSTITVTRKDGGVDTEYSTTFGYAGANYGDYHHPYLITEDGTAGTRTTQRSFLHYPTPYVLALIDTETVAVGGETFTSSWTYEATTGFRKTETIYGITAQFQRDSYGNVASATSASNKTTTFRYQYGRPRSITTPEYAITRTINPDGSLASEIRGGRATAFTYDDSGRLTMIQPPGGTNPTIFDYDNIDGAWVRTTRGTSQITVSLDGFGRKVSTANAVNIHQNTAYDAEGRVVLDGYPYRPGDLSGGTDIATALDYDALGRIVTRANPDGSGSSRLYSGGGLVMISEQVSAQSVRTTTQTWKGFGNPDETHLTQVIDADSHVWDYTYNALGSLRTVSLDGTVVRQWTYDSHGLLQTETHPESGTTTYTYVAGALVDKADARGNHTAFTYDGNDRIRTITAGGRPTNITYEPGTDNRTSAINGSDGVIWRYDVATGRLQSRQDAIDGKLFTTAYEYDANDHLSVVQYPSGRRVQYVVNAEGQPIRVYEATANRNYATSITYHASGGVGSYSASNGITTTMAYDAARYWATGITAGPLEIGYSGYDYVGNPGSVTTSSGGTAFSQALTYDALDRLSTAVGPQGTSTFTYDAHGNRSGTGYQYESGTMRLLNQGGTVFTYDDNGNAKSIGGATFTYTPQNQVETVASPGYAVTYAYDADDERVRKTSGSSTTYYIRSLSGELLTEWQDPGTSTGRIRDYIYLGNRLLSAVSRTSSEMPLDPSQPNTLNHRYATSWQVPAGAGGPGSALLQTGASVAARKSSHPDMPRTGLRLGVHATASLVDVISVGPTTGNSNPAGWKQGGAFLEFSVERYPTVNAEWLSTSGGVNATDDLRLYVTPGGQLLLTHDDGRATPQTLWTSSAVGLDTPHTVELRFEYSSTTTQPLPNPSWDLTSWAQVYYDGALVAVYGAVPGGGWVSGETSPLGLDRTNGIAGLTSINLRSPGGASGLLMNVWRFGEIAAQAHSETLGGYGNAWRTTLLEVAGAGSYNQWPGGQSDWRARSAIAGTGGFDNPVSASAANQKISYKIESMLARGITGHIGTVMVGVKMQFVSPDSRAFVRRNGVDTVLSDFILSSSNYTWYRVAQGGWSPTDSVEIGVTSGSGGAGLNWLQSVAVIVEHDTPEPEPVTDTSAQIVTLTYSGNGGAQTIDLGVNQLPTALFVMPTNIAGGVEPLWWWDSRQGAAQMSQSVTNFARVWPQKGKLHVVHNANHSYNASGVAYTVIAIFDPSSRYILPFAVSKPLAEDNYTHRLRYPQTGALADTFTPDFVFGGAAFSHQSDSSKASLYKGPGHVGDLTAQLGTASASDADRIQAIGTGTVQFGTLIGHGQGDHAFWAGRVNDGVSPTRLMAVTSYVGNGATSRTIALSLNNQAPVLTFVVPATAVAKAYRVSGDNAARRTDSGYPITNSITAMAANQITVGTALNAVGVTYDVWAVTTGFVQPQ